jgi:hypothetical protein
MTRTAHPLHRPHWTPALEESRGCRWWWNAHPPTWHKEPWSIKKQHSKSNNCRETLEFKARKGSFKKKGFSDMIYKRTEDPFASSTTLENAFGCCKDQTKTSQALKVSMILPLKVHLR